jgi:hypothetical protein
MPAGKLVVVSGQPPVKAGPNMPEKSRETDVST